MSEFQKAIISVGIIAAGCFAASKGYKASALGLAVAGMIFLMYLLSKPERPVEHAAEPKKESTESQQWGAESWGVVIMLLGVLPALFWTRFWKKSQPPIVPSVVAERAQKTSPITQQQKPEPAVRLHLGGNSVSPSGIYEIYVGEVENISSVTIMGVKVIATFYDSSERIVDTDFSYVDGPLMPGEKGPFKFMRSGREGEVRSWSAKASPRY